MYVEAASLYLVVDLVQVDKNMFEFGAEFVLPLCDYPHTLLDITQENRHLVRFQRRSP